MSVIRLLVHHPPHLSFLAIVIVELRRCRSLSQHFLIMTTAVHVNLINWLIYSFILYLIGDFIILRLHHSVLLMCSWHLKIHRRRLLLIDPQTLILIISQWNVLLGIVLGKLLVPTIVVVTALIKWLTCKRYIYKLLTLDSCVEELNRSIDTATWVDIVQSLFEKSVVFSVPYCIDHPSCDLILWLSY